MLSELLSSMRLSGGVFLDGEMSAPWSVLSHLEPADCEPYFPAPSHVIAYHYVRSGRLSCQVGEEPPVPVRAGEIVMIPRSEPHYLHGAVPGTPVDGKDVMGEPDADGMFRIRMGGDGEKTAVYCGFLGSSTPENMLLRSLPSVMVIAIDDAAESDWIRRSLDFAVHGLVIARRNGRQAGRSAFRRSGAPLHRQPAAAGGGMDRRAARSGRWPDHRPYPPALRRGAHARRAGARSGCFEDRAGRALPHAAGRIADAILRALADACRRRHAPQEQAERLQCRFSVGFNSEAAFNRAFKREFGLPPAAWQRARAAA